MKNHRLNYSPSTISSQNDWASFWSQPVRDTETEQQFPQHRKKQTKTQHKTKRQKKTKKQPTKDYQDQSRVLQRGEEEDTRRAHRACARDTAIPVTWWADGWSHDYMHTKSYKSQVQHSFFKWHDLGLCVVPLRPAGLCFFFFFLVFWRPTEAFMSLLGCSFGACREQRGRGQFTVSPVPMARELHRRLSVHGFTLEVEPFHLLCLRIYSFFFQVSGRVWNNMSLLEV